MVKRTLNLPKNHSFFLFGPRGSGKTSLIRETFIKNVSYHDLLNQDLELSYSERPELFSEELEALPTDIKTVVIDEVQKVPRLLDIVHRYIENKKFSFVLTGSSSRKLKRGAANLLAGRAFVFNLYPLLAEELGADFDLKEALEFGTLPKIYSLDRSDRIRFLRAYAQTYLREEVWAEQFIRNLSPFSRFLEVAAQNHGQIINFSKIAREVGVDHKTVENYYSILEDTLLGFFLTSYDRSFRKQIRQAPKFYLFDQGVKRALDKSLGYELNEKSYEYGTAFEHFIIREIMARASYRELDYNFNYLRTESGAEIDLIISSTGRKPLLIEIKSTTLVTPEHFRHLKALTNAFPKSSAYLLCREKRARKVENIWIFPWKEGIERIFSE